MAKNKDYDAMMNMFSCLPENKQDLRTVTNKAVHSQFPKHIYK